MADIYHLLYFGHSFSVVYFVGLCVCVHDKAKNIGQAT